MFAGVIVFLVAGAAALAYAMWIETLRVNGYVSSGEVDICYLGNSVIQSDPYGPGNYDYNVNWSMIPAKIIFRTDKDVAYTNTSLWDSDGDGDMDTMNVTIYNAYPWYFNHIAFEIKNCGTIPVKIWRVKIWNGTDDFVFYEIQEQQLQRGTMFDLDGDGKADVLIWWGDNFGKQLHPGDYADISFDITILQNATENTLLQFSITLEAVQWNEYYIP